RDDWQITEFAHGADGLPDLGNVGERFETEQINAACEQPGGLCFEHLARLVKRSWTIRLDAQAEWTNSTGDVGAIAGGFPSDLCAERVDLVETAFESVLLELVSSSAERVGLVDVCAGAYVFGMNLAHQIGVTEIQLIVAAVDVDAFGVEHRPHRAIDDEYAVGSEKFLKRFHRCLATKKSRAKQRGTSNPFEVFRVSQSLPELFSWLFYVAASRLNSPRFSWLLIRRRDYDCQV